MKILIVEDDLTSRMVLQGLLKPYGQRHVAVNGKEAVEAARAALAAGEPYDLICLDIMMPVMDGQEAPQRDSQPGKGAGIRGRDEVKIIMMTALDDPKNVVEAYYKGGATKYLVKPIDKHLLIEAIRRLGLIG